jgi:hypothetical protein
VAKTRKPASRAKKGTKKSVKRTKKAAPKPKAMAAKSAKQVPSLDLKKLRDDIAQAKTVVANRLAGASGEKAQKLMQTQSTLDQWTADINSICGTTEEEEPCGTTMVIS